MDNKTDLRIWAKSIRKTLDISSKSTAIASKIKAFEVYRAAKNVMLFYPKRYEIDLLSLLADNKNFYLPRVCADKLLVCPFKRGEELKISDFKICEPCSEPINPLMLDLVIVPALALDRNGFRLGYGGGFYDRFLSQYPVKSIAVAPDELFLESVFPKDFDVKTDFIITA